MFLEKCFEVWTSIKQERNKSQLLLLLRVFSRTWHCSWYLVCLYLELFACFPELCTGYMFSRAWNWLCFPALGTGDMFSRTWKRSHVFPPSAPVTRLHRHPGNWLHAFPLLLCVLIGSFWFIQLFRLDRCNHLRIGHYQLFSISNNVPSKQDNPWSNDLS